MTDGVRLEFDEATHTYRIGGRVVPSVTQIVREMLGGYNAEPWYMKRGRELHAAYAMLALGKTPAVDPQLEGHVAQARHFFYWLLIEKAAQVVSVEYPVWSRLYQYAGTLDLLVVLDGALTVIDYKGTMDARNVYQLTGYSVAHEESDGVRIPKGISVEIQGDYWRMSGRYDLIRYRNRWLAMRTVYGIRQELGVAGKGDK
jgi:hypothetical protein